VKLIVRINMRRHCPLPLFNAVIVLNTPIPSSAPLFQHLWSGAVRGNCDSRVRVCADGGANRLHEWIRDNRGAFQLPDAIVGDLDSLETEVRAYFVSHGVKVKDMSDDQDTTDLEKCLAFVAKKAKGRENECAVVAYGSFGDGGRLDHVFGILNTLYKWRGVFGNVAWVSETHTARVLGPGKHELIVDHGIAVPHSCGLVPLGGPVRCVTTDGLVWDMHDASMSFGGLVSACNRIKKGTSAVSIQLSDPAVWMTTITTVAAPPIIGKAAL